MGRNKDKKKKKEEEKEDPTSQVNVEEDKNLFQDIFGVTIDEIEKEEESEEEKYDDILEDIDEISLDIDEKEVPTLEEPIIEEPSVSKAVEILTRVPSAPIIEETKIPPPVQIVKPKPLPPDIPKPIISIPTKTIVKPIPKQPQFNIPAPPKFKRIQPKPMEPKIVPTELIPKEIPASKDISKMSQSSGIMKTISFQGTVKEEPKPKTIKVVEPKPAFKTANLFMEEQDFEHQDKDKDDVSDIRCANCGKRISKKAEESLKAGWIINCDDCGGQIISH